MRFTTTKFEIDILNVKNADAILIRCFDNDDEYIILIDAGNISDSKAIKNHLENVYENTYIDLAICTHSDNDHIGGFFDLLDDSDINIGEFWLIDPAEYLDENDIQRYRNKQNAENAVRKLFNKPNGSGENLITKLLSSGINTYSVSQGSEHSKIPIKVVAPSSGYYNELVKEMVSDFGLKTYEEQDTSIYDENALPNKSDVKSVIDIDDDKSPYNASSIVLLFEPEKNKKFLFTGDSNCASLNEMIEKYDDELTDITILKVPHHGSKHNLTTEIIEHLNPSISIVSARGSKKHPNSGIVYWLSQYGNVYSTHKNGNLHYHSGTKERKNYSSADPLKKRK
jgi:beta-lactamase superfamily II metal-dependent hydrolase